MNVKLMLLLSLLSSSPSPRHSFFSNRDSSLEPLSLVMEYWVVQKAFKHIGRFQTTAHSSPLFQGENVRAGGQSGMSVRKVKSACTKVLVLELVVKMMIEQCGGHGYEAMINRTKKH